MVECYKDANRRDGRHPYEYGNADRVALNMLERRSGDVIIGLRLHGDDVKVHMREGVIMPDGTTFLNGETHDCLLRGFEDSTTITRFARAICDVVDERADHRLPDVKAAMMNNAKAYSQRVRQELVRYSS